MAVSKLNQHLSKELGKVLVKVRSKQTRCKWTNEMGGKKILSCDPRAKFYSFTFLKGNILSNNEVQKVVESEDRGGLKNEKAQGQAVRRRVIMFNWWKQQRIKKGGRMF